MFQLTPYLPGYSGVAIYTRNATCAPVRAEEGVTGVLTPPQSSTKFRDLPEDQRIGGYPMPGQLSGNVDELELDSEGRCVILEFPAFVLLGVYSPANRNESRHNFRVAFLEALDVRIRNLVASGKQVILTGDLNVIRSEIDSTNVAECIRKEGMSLEEWKAVPSRRIFNHLIFDGDVSGQRDEGREIPVLWDLCRCFHPSRQGMNTCWDTKRNTRPANNGSRIDYILCSAGLKSWFAHADIQQGLMGSDHCPVFGMLADVVHVEGRHVSIKDMMNPPGMFSDGERLREWSHRDSLPLSARLIPEFDRRQSIRDMFSRTASGGQQSLSQKPGSIPSSSSSATTVRKPDLVSKEDANASEIFPATTAQSLASPRKRSPAVTTTFRSTKRPRQADGSSSAGANAQAGQRTLQGFFKPVGQRHQDTAETLHQSPRGGAVATESPTASTVTTELPAQDVQNSVAPAEKSSQPLLSPDRSASPVENVFDPIEAKESWSRLLGKRVPPRCEHDEPCISLLTKKPGVNCGRSFYICRRPLGPSGEKEHGSEWRCGTFIWSSDWSKQSM
ncbi:DNA-(apurinic or apyrimidinic site) lyase [Purpureocillium takamizusanense]|uniref:DNA-(apurinic or apyrimidinic site) endonuclease 2 n=1 Tax=Purpureocillium takamizusanense TaxID=2060973 RepID=A0A9Q8VEX7_9HYPO|nr:DNA-(apurinic or apyrimidinic site) lyase [Purpureocillium takamizusanense]UNI24395.1 DNA-(apurinic or apyrimidinic site) lyase [Purpureocillium takamizusanense]